MVTLSQPNFTAGELTPLAQGRTDLLKFAAALRTCKNWIIRPHGCLMNRQGLRYVSGTKVNAKKSILIPFVFNDTQSYMLEFGELYVRVYSNGSTASIAEVATPYLESDLQSLQYAQSADVLTVTLSSRTQYELRRTSSTTFTFLPVTYDDGPFLTANTNKQIVAYASATTGTVTLTANSPIFAATHVSGLFYLQQQNVGDVAPWEPTKLLTSGAASPVGLIRRNDGKTYKCVAAAVSAANTATGSIPPTHTEGVQLDGDAGKIASFADVCGVSWLYMDSGFGIIRITGFTSPTIVTGTVVKQLPSTVVGGITVAFGPFTFSGDGATKSFTPLAATTTTDPTKYVVTIGGVIQDPATYTVTVGGPILFVAAPAVGTNNIIVNQVAANNRSYIWAFGAWSPNQGYPTTVTYFQDRLFYAGSQGQPQAVWASKTGVYTSFGTSVPSQDDDALTFLLNARQINTISDLISLESLITGTSSAIWRVTAGIDEVLTPSTVGFKPQNYFGSYTTRSVNVGDSAIYAQTDGRRVRDLQYEYQFDKFRGNELSLLAEHMFPYGTTIKGLNYEQTPFSLVHVTRSDGLVPTLSYLREQDVLGWSLYETAGVIESMRSIPENGVTATYAIVRRNIDGNDVRYIEKFANREYATIEDAFFVDAGISYDYRNTTAVTLTITGGTLWNNTEALTVTASTVGIFNSGVDTGNEVWLYDADGNKIRLRYISFVGTNVVTAVPIGVVPASLRGTATTIWSLTRKVFAVPHLNGEAVSILADGMDVDPQTVTTSQVTLLHPAAVVHIGLPYHSDLETLDFNVQNAESVRAKTKTIPQVTLLLYSTRGVYVGPDFDHLDEFAQREYEDLQDAIEPVSDILMAPVRTRIDKSGRICVRQSRPLPITILGLQPDIEFGS